MAPLEPNFGPLQLIVVGFETTENFHGQIARELRDLRGRGLIRVLDARMLSRHADGKLTETDLNPYIGEPEASEHRPVAHLFGLNGAGRAGGNGGMRAPEAFSRTAGFALEDLRRLTDEIGYGQHAAVVLVEHVWAARLRELVRDAGGLLVAQGMLTPEVVMIVGAELQAKADAEAAIELADAARGAALLEALSTLTEDHPPQEPQPAAAAAAAVVRALVDAGFVAQAEAAEAIDALATRGIVEQALLHGAVAEAEELLARLEDSEPPLPGRMSEAAERHAALAARLRESGAAPDRVLDAFARVPRHLFLPGASLELAYTDDAIVTHDEDGVPTSSSSQPSLMARMLEMLDVEPGARVLEIGAGTGYNAAVLAELGAHVTTVELQPEVAEAAAVHLQRAGVEAAPGSVTVVTGDGAAPPDGPYDRVIVTAGCWALPARLVGALADGGVLVAPLRVNGVELAIALRRDGDALHGTGGLPCGFMPLRGGEERPWRWPLGGGGTATADADLGDEGRGGLDRLLATPGRPVEDPLGLREGEHALDALLWLGLRGDPLISLVRGGSGASRPGWTVALDVLPASLLVIALGPAFGRVRDAVLHGGEGALRTCAAAMTAWRAAGSPGPAALELHVDRSDDRTGWSLPFPAADGAATMTRGAHRWTLRYGSPSAFSPQNDA